MEGKCSTAQMMPEFFGGKGDGVTDCTAAIQRCLNETGACFLSKGEYKITAPIVMPNQTRLFGAGKGAVLRFDNELGYPTDGSVYMVVIPVTSTFCTIDHISLDGGRAASGIYDGKGRERWQATRVLIDGVRITNYIIGITLNAMGSEVRNAYIHGKLDCSRIGLNILLTDNRISDSRIMVNNQYGVYIGHNSNGFANVKSCCNQIGFYIKGNNQTLWIEAQENYGDNIIMDGVTNSIISGSSNGAGCKSRKTHPEGRVGNGSGCVLSMLGSRNNIINLVAQVCVSYSGNFSNEEAVLKMSGCENYENDIKFTYCFDTETRNDNFEVVKGMVAGNRLMMNTRDWSDDVRRLRMEAFEDVTSLLIADAVPAANNVCCVKFKKDACWQEGCQYIVFVRNRDEYSTVDLMGVELIGEERFVVSDCKLYNRKQVCVWNLECTGQLQKKLSSAVGIHVIAAEEELSKQCDIEVKILRRRIS